MGASKKENEPSAKMRRGRSWEKSGIVNALSHFKSLTFFSPMFWPKKLETQYKKGVRN